MSKKIERAHALLSASGAKQWLACPPSVRLSENIPDTSSSFAKEGDMAHKVAETVNKREFSQISEIEYQLELGLLQSDKLYDSEMLQYATEFKDFICEKATASHSLVWFEERVDFSKYVPEGFGTCDVLLRKDDRVAVIDYKYGKGVEVSAEDNPQLKLYALGALEKFTDDKPKIVEMVIYQPRINNISTCELLVEDLLEWAEKDVKPKALLAYDGAGDFKSGEHCRWCKLKPSCKRLAFDSLKALDTEVSPLLSVDEFSRLLKVVDIVKGWAESVKSHALNMAVNGNEIPDFKLVEGRSTRIISDEEGLIKMLKEEGYSYNDIFEMKLVGIGKLEKMLEKNKSILKPYIEKPLGAPTLVPKNDKREEFNNPSFVFEGVDTSIYD